MTKSEYQQLAAFRYELRKFLRFSELAARRHGLASMQYLALLAMEGSPLQGRITVGDLAERLHVAPHSAVGLVDRLEASKLASRMSSDGDHRQVYVKITAKGRARLEKLAAVHHQVLQISAPALIQELSRLINHHDAR